MTHPDRDPTVTEPWREAYEAWVPDSDYANHPEPEAYCFCAGYLAALEARAQPDAEGEQLYLSGRQQGLMEARIVLGEAVTELVRIYDAGPAAQPVRVTVEEFINSEPVGEILRTMCFQVIDLSRLWRETGTEIEHRAEDEQAFFMRLMLHAAARDPADWRGEFGKEVGERIEQAKALLHPEGSPR